MCVVCRVVDSGLVDPPESVALDEAILDAHSGGSVTATLHLYVRSRPTVSVGYFQKVAEGLDLEACRRLGVAVVRRGSGGSSIYTDQGQLIYALVLASSMLPATPDASFTLVCGSIAEALSALGVDARHRPVNDVEVGGRKVSGSAQLKRGSSTLVHGTIVVDTDLAKMDAVLRPCRGQRPSERVANLSALLGEAPAMDDVKRLLMRSFSTSLGLDLEEGSLTDGEEETVRRLVTERYSRDEWNLRL